MLPPDTGRMPESILRMVDLPQPEGPSRQISSPSGSVTEKVLTAVTPGNFLVTFSSLTCMGANLAFRL